MKTFAYHIVLSKNNICNYQNVSKLIKKEILNGQRLVLFGRRNTGKTSLVKSLIIPEFKKAYKNGLVVTVDFMGVRHFQQINDRFRMAFQEGFSSSFPKKSTFDKMVQLVKSLRPKLTVDSLTGEMSFTISSSREDPKIHLATLMDQIAKIHKKTRSFLVFDEFQDIAFVPEAEAKMRAALQNLPSDLPVMILGSKKHLLSKMFADPKAPLANWGLPIELSPISAKDYQKYINDRFSEQGLSISLDDTQYLLNLLQNIPECINLVCYMIQADQKNRGDVTKATIHRGIKMVLDRFESNYIEFLSSLTVAEQDFLTVLAKNQPILHPRAHQFIKKLRSSPSGASKIVKKLEDEAVIYKIEDGYVVGDPLLAIFLAEKR